MGKLREWNLRQSAQREKAARAIGLAAMDSQATDGEPIKALIINLEGSRERFERISGYLERAGVAFERTPGTKASDLPAYAVRRLAPNLERVIENARNAHKRMGTLGCFLGHIKAWEKVASGDGRHHLILEDDVVPYGPLPRSIEALNVVQDFDICFCNERMEPVFVEGQAFPTRPTLFSALEARNSRPPFQKAIGGDAYFLSKNGAAKLLEVVERIGTIEHVDWFLFALGIREDEAGSLRADDVAKKVNNRFRRHLGPVRDIAFRVTALWPALMHAGGFPTTRKAESAA